jgi:hypothetical protein
MFTALTLLGLLLGIGAGISIVYWSIRNGISPMPTSPRVAAKLLEALPEKVKGTVFELGSGWGSLAFPLAEKYPLNCIKAYESSPVPYYFSRLRLWIFPHANLQIHRRDFFEAPLGEAALIVCYLYPGAMQRLKDKFERELAPGTHIVSNTFAVPGWTALKTIDTGDIYGSKIFVYRL